jgi:hypothetical protein
MPEPTREDLRAQIKAYLAVLRVYEAAGMKVRAYEVRGWLADRRWRLRRVLDPLANTAREVRRKERPVPRRA